MSSRYMLEAMESWGRELTGEPALPRGLYGFSSHINLRRVEPGKSVYLHPPYLTWTQREYDFEFQYDFNDNTTPNAGEVLVYNLTDATITGIRVGDHIECMAGYSTTDSDDRDGIFAGIVTGVETEKNGPDRETTLYFVNTASGVGRGAAGEDKKDLSDGGTFVSLAYSEGVSAGFILRDLCGKTALPIAVFEIENDRVFSEAVTIEGDINKKISEYAAMCGAWAYEMHGLLYVKDLRKDPPLVFTINETRGMIDAPTPFEESVRDTRTEDAEGDIVYKGYNVKMLMMHRVATGIGMRIDSEKVQGVFTIKSGRHTFDGLSAVTEVKCIGS